MHSTTRALMTRQFVLAAVVCLTVLALTPYATLAKTTTWTNLSPSDDLWSNPGNWDAGIPSFFDIVVFDPIGGTSTQDIGGLTLQEMSMGTYSGVLTLLQPLDIAGSLQTSGLFDMTGNSLSVGGNISVEGDFDATSATVLVANDVTVDGSFTGTSGALITVQGSLQLAPGATLDMGDGWLEIEQDLSLADGISTWTTGTLRFQGLNPQSWDAGPSSSNYGNVEINNGGGSDVQLVAPGLTVEIDNLLINQGRLAFYAAGLTVHGQTDIASGAELYNGQSNTTLQFDGPVTVDGEFVSNWSGCTLRFAPGAANKVAVRGTATLDVQGLAGDRTRMEQDGAIGGSQWILDHDAGTTLNINDVIVQDSDAQGTGGTATATGTSINGGNTTNWNFPPKATMWTGGGISDNWSDYANWDNGVPATDDEVTFDLVGGSSFMNIPGLTLDEMDMSGYSGTLWLIHDLSFWGDLIVDGTLDASGHTLSVGGSLVVYGDLDATSTTWQVAGNVVSLGDVDGTSSSWTIGGNIDIDGGFYMPDSFFDVDMSGTISTSGALDLVPNGYFDIALDLTVSGALDADNATVVVNGSVTSTGGLIDMGGGTLQVGDDLNVGTATMTWSSSGTLRFERAGPGAVVRDWTAGPSSSNYGNVLVGTTGGPGGGVVLSAPGQAIVVNDLDVVGRPLSLVAGDLTVNGQTTVSNQFSNTTNTGATLQFNGNVSLAPGGTFSSTAAGCTYRFAAGGTVDLGIVGQLTVSGVPGNRTRLEQDGVAGGTQWILSHGVLSASTFTDVEVQDSDSQGKTATATGTSIDLGNNTNWSFPPKTTAWTGGGGTSNWSDSGNWDNGVPVSGDDVASYAVGGISTMDIPGLILNEMNMTGFSGSLAINHDMSVATDLVLDGATSALGRAFAVGGHVVSLGDVDAPGSSWAIGGNIDIDGGFYMPDSFFDVDMSGAISASGAVDLTGSSLLDVGVDLTVSGGTLLADNATILVIGSVTGAGGGTLSLGSSSLTLAGDLDVSGAATTWTSGGTLNFAGSAPQGWSASSSSSNYGAVQVNTGAGVNKVTLSAPSTNIHVTDLQVSSGTLELAAGDLTVDGDMTVSSGGTFENLSNMGATLTFNGKLTVNDGTFTSIAGGCTLAFTAGPTGMVDLNGSATFDATGSGGIRTRLEQDGVQGGTQWILDYEPGTTLMFDDVEVQDSDAQPGPVTATGISIDLGNNTNWIFPPKTTSWTGAGVSDNWSDGGNWNNGVPGNGDDVGFLPVSGLSVMDISGLVLNDMNMTTFAGTLDLAQPLSVGGSLATDGLFDMSGGDLLVAGNVDMLDDVDAAGGTISVGGHMTFAGPALAGNSVVIAVAGDFHVSGSADLILSNIDVTGNMTVNGSLLGNGATITVGGSFQGAGGGNLSMASGTLQVEGDASFGGLSTNTWTSSGTLRFTGGGTQSWTASPSTSSFGDVEVAGGGGGRVMLNTPAALTFVDDLHVTSGALELVGGDLTVGGVMTVGVGATFENLTNNGATLRIMGDVAVNNGTFSSIAGGCTVSFAASPTAVDIDGASTFQISGLPGNRTVIEQDGVLGGTQWVLDHEPTAGMIFVEVEVQDSHAQPTAVVATGNSVDRGNTTNWIFPAKTTAWTNGLGTGNWSDFGNWDNGVPATGDDVTSTPVGGLSTMDMPGLALNSLDFTGFSGTLRVDEDLDIAGFVTTSGTFSIERTVNVGGNLTGNGVVDIAAADVTVGGALHINGDLDLDLGSHLDTYGPIDGTPGSSLRCGNGTLTVRDDTDLSNFAHLDFSDPLSRLELLGSGNYLTDIGDDTLITAMLIGGNLHSATFDLRCGSLLITDTLDIDTGILDLDVDTLEVAQWTTIGLNGTLQGTRARSTFKFSDMIVAGRVDISSDSAAIFIPAGATLTLLPSSNFTLSGGSQAARAKLLLDGPPRSAQWHLDVQPGATTLFENIEVGDSDASPGETQTASGECIDLGNNDNWNFVGTATGDTPPSQLTLKAVPNPFNPQTTLHYGVPIAGDVTIRIYNVRGSLVRTLVSARHEPGVYAEPWSGRDDHGSSVATGVYLCRIESVGASVVRKLVLLK